MAKFNHDQCMEIECLTKLEDQRNCLVSIKSCLRMANTIFVAFNCFDLSESFLSEHIRIRCGNN